MVGVIPVGCGRCLCCRINRRRVWTNRILLESYTHPSSLFITLTYDDAHLPSDASLMPDHPKDWMKRYRKKSSPKRCKFYLVGEYGEKTRRPHYHLALFNASAHEVPYIQLTWKMGNIHVGDLTPASAGYICGYVTKNYMHPDNPRLEGRYPEYARMSNRPGGIGASAMIILADAIMGNQHLMQEIKDQGDVPGAILVGKKLQPLGQYLKQKLRKELGMPDDYRSEAIWTLSLKMSGVLQDALASSPDSPKSRSETFAHIDAQKVLQVETLYNIHSKDRPL